MPTITASELRARIYNLLDQVLETGEPLEIERKGRILRIVAEEQPSKLGRLVRRDHVIKGDPDSLIHVDWSAEWRP